MKRGGGTAVEETSPVWTAALVGVGVLVVLLVLSMRGGEDDVDAPPARSAAGVATEDIDPEALPAPISDVEQGDFDPESDETRIQAATLLETELGSGELWSTVEPDNVDSTLLLIRTEFCTEKGVAAGIEKHRATLKKAGYTVVHCLEPHGEMVSEEPL